MVKSYKLFINGEWVETQDALEVPNKYTQETYAKVSKASEQEVTQAVDAAERAFKENPMPPYKRYQILKRVSELLQEKRKNSQKLLPLKQANL